MNSGSLKYTSFFYSLAIHLALGLVVFGLYLQEDEKHEVYSLVNLKSMHICTPETAKPLIKEQVKVKKQPKKKIEAVKPIKKVTKPVIKPNFVKKTVPLRTEPIKKVVLVQNEVSEPVQKIEKESVAQEEVEALEKEVVTVEESTPLVAVSEPEVSYEAQYMQDNIALINALIKKNLSYPRLAKKRGLQGKAMVSFTLSLEGEVLDIEALGVLSSVLKKSAIKTVKKASSSFPKPSQVLALRIPIVYKLH